MAGELALHCCDTQTSLILKSNYEMKVYKVSDFESETLLMIIRQRER